MCVFVLTSVVPKSVCSVVDGSISKLACAMSDNNRENMHNTKMKQAHAHIQICMRKHTHTRRETVDVKQLCVAARVVCLL